MLAEYGADAVQVFNNWLADHYGLTWWMVWYDFALLVAVTASAVLGRLKEHSQVLCSFLASLLAVYMFQTHDATVLSRGAKNTVRPGSSFIYLRP